MFALWFQVVEDVTEFYKQTYSNYRQTKQEALKETLRLIHFGVRMWTWATPLTSHSIFTSPSFYFFKIL